MGEITRSLVFPSFYVPLCIVAYSVLSANYANLLWLLGNIPYDSSVLLTVCLFGVVCLVLSKTRFEVTVTCAFQ